ncbi:MAG: 3-deoxy-manno-octulosonate cytidylyltransferase [Alphaproteobacteria bacterium]|nr:3-deoxy-manno-octulosonate cytidylyltransferase [Alphaproteobacteria bacterium]
MKIAIAIPARYASTRFPGKPLAKIGGQTMLARVSALARSVAAEFTGITLFITTEDERIASHAAELGMDCVLTPADCPTGSDRVLAALRQLPQLPDFVINLQGDAPFTPPSVLRALIQAFKDDPQAQIVTPVHRLGWADLDRLRAAKKTTPFSGTTAILNADNQALWFSKTIIPAIRGEDRLRTQEPVSPVYQHMGVYGFRTDILEKFCSLPQGVYEQLEGLEQLRMLENGLRITAVKVDLEPGAIQSGIDTPEDLERAEALLSA